MILGKAKLENMPRLQIDGNVFLILKYLVYNFQTTYIGIAMLNSYATNFHLSYISSNSSNVLVYQRTIYSTSMSQ